MDRRRFWEIIEAARKKAKGDRDAHVDALAEHLQPLSPEEVASFEEHFIACSRQAYRYDLWGAATVIDGFWVSDDGFMDFRAWLISKGKKVYENALRDPDTLTKAVEEGEDCEFEGFGSVAGSVWEEKTGRSMQYMLPEQEAPPKSPEGERWEDDEDLQRRFPKLWKKFQGE